MLKRPACLGCVGATGILFLSLGICTLILFDPYVDKEIQKELVLRNGTEVYKVWKDPPIVPHLNIYFFNLTNGQEFLKGQPPIFEELGPYCYREHWQKVNISFFDNGTVTYQTQRFYYFDQSRSKGNESDLVHTINMPMITSVMKLRDAPRFVRLTLSSLLATLNEEVLITKSVKDLMWGYEDKLIDIAKDLLPPDQGFPFDKFGFFYQRNGSADGVFNVFTGRDDMRKYTSIDMFNHKRKMNFWKTDECNAINGTDGSSYPPNVTPKSVLYLFNENLCRSLPVVYVKDIEKYGVNGYRFSPPVDIFASPDVNPANRCFCDSPPCIGGGVFNTSICQFGAPTLISWPHFYQADKKYLDKVVGLKPDPAKHAFYVDIAPRAGIPLTAQARIQINIFMTAVSGIKAAEELPTIVFPVMWFEDGVETMPEEIIEKIRMSQNLPEVAKATLLSCFFAFGAILALLAIIALIASLFSIHVKYLNPKSEKDQSGQPKRDLHGFTNPEVIARPDDP